MVYLLCLATTLHLTANNEKLYHLVALNHHRHCLFHFSQQPKQPQRGTLNRRVRIRGGRGQHRINNVGARRQLQIGDPDISFQPEQLDDSVGLGKQVYKRLKKGM